jgi:hypothetical protein
VWLLDCRVASLLAKTALAAKGMDECLCPDHHVGLKAANPLSSPGGTMLPASCHCGAVQFEIDRKPRQLTDCNCSICRRYGALWAYYRRKSIYLRPGSLEAMSSYSWGDKALAFRHCRTCGCVVYHERTKDEGDETRIGVNARMMSPSDIASLRIRHLDGASTWEYLD